MPINPTADAPSASEEWRHHWPLVLAALVGLSFATLPSATLGLFMQPLSDEFGWSRTEVSIGLSIFALVSLPLTPFAGVLVDRWGARRVALPGLLISGTCFAAFSLMSGTLAQWVLIWVIYTLASLMTRTLVWSSAISKAFVTGRGLALAVILSGTAVATALGPIVTRILIDEAGWRGGYLGLGLGWGGFALVLAVFLFRGSSVGDGRAAATQGGGSMAMAPRQLPGGLTLGDAMRNRPMQRIAFAMFIQSVMATAILVHIVPMLTADGLSRAEAAAVAALLGVASLMGKLGTGWLVDRIGVGLLPVLAFGGPAVAYTLLLQAKGTAWLLSGAVFLLGYCSGATLQLATYLTTRYAGLRNFGAIFGVLSSLMAGAAGVGPLLAATIFDRTGSYTLQLMLGAAAAAIAGLAVFRLGPYPAFAPVTPEPQIEEKPAAA
jgi:MFS family permease